ASAATYRPAQKLATSTSLTGGARTNRWPASATYTVAGPARRAAKAAATARARSFGAGRPVFRAPRHASNTNTSQNEANRAAARPEAPAIPERKVAVNG